MKVPRINVGVDNEPEPVTELWKGREVGRIDYVDHIDGLFTVVGGQRFLQSSDYRPLPTMNNFMRAIREWDYHYRASDDPRLYEEGKEYEAALIELFRRLPEEDQHNCRKIVEIVVMSTTPK